MGFPSDRFIRQDISQEFFCSICQDILQDPILLEPCEHLFCRECIEEWVEENETCPIDRSIVPNESLANPRQPQRAFRNLLNDLEIRCEFFLAGCREILKLGEIDGHALRCLFDPKNLIASEPCRGGCGAVLTRIQNGSHPCIQYLKTQVEAKDREILDLKGTLRGTNALDIVRNTIAGIDAKSSFLTCRDYQGDLATKDLIEEVVMGCVQKFEIQGCVLSPGPIAKKVGDELGKILGESWGCVILGNNALVDPGTKYGGIQMYLSIGDLFILVWKYPSETKNILLSEERPVIPYHGSAQLVQQTSKLFKVIVTGRILQSCQQFAISVIDLDGPRGFQMSTNVNWREGKSSFTCCSQETTQREKSHTFKSLKLQSLFQVEITFTHCVGEYEVKVNNEEPFVYKDGIPITGNLVQIVIHGNLTLSLVKLERLA